MIDQQFTGVLETCCALLNEIKKRSIQLLEKDERSMFPSHDRSEISRNNFPSSLIELGSKSGSKNHETFESEFSFKINDFKEWMSKIDQEILKNLDNAIESNLVLTASVKHFENGVENSAQNMKISKENLENSFNRKIHTLEKQIKTHENSIKELKEELHKAKSNSFDISRQIFSEEIDKLIKEKDDYKFENESLKSEIELLKIEMDNKIIQLNNNAELNIKNMNENYNDKVRELEEMHNFQLENFESKIKSRESELLSLKSENKDEGIITSMKYSLDTYMKLNSRLESVLGIIKEASNRIFKSFCLAHNQEFNTKRREIAKKYSNLSDEDKNTIIEIEFIGYLILNLNLNNGHLIEKIDYLESENEKLVEAQNKKERIIQEMVRDYNNSSKVLQDFTDSRNKLTQQFVDKSYDSVKSPKGGVTFMKLYQKYLGDENS